MNQFFSSRKKNEESNDARIPSLSVKCNQYCPCYSTKRISQLYHHNLCQVKSKAFAMGNSQSSTNDSSAATITPIHLKTKDGKATNKPLRRNDTNDDASEVPLQSNTKSLETPILLSDDDVNDDGGFPTPTGREYDLIDQIASELPAVIDDESNQQVQDYIEACDNGRGPMVACYSTAEYLSLFLRKHKEASTLYENTCFRPKGDKSANGVSMDKGRSKAYPPACYNLAQMRMTGKGNTKFDRKEGYQLFDRACRAGHGGSCHMQAKMLASHPGSLGKGIPYNPRRAASLLDGVCENGDSLSCFTLATMLLRGDVVNAEADNVTPDEARGLAPVKQRENEVNRVKDDEDKRVALNRDPLRAEQLLLKSCEERGHAPSCYNLAVMYTQGDDGIERNDEKALKFQKKTEEFVDKFGGFGFGGSMG
jgi:TPR repeat protein